MKIYCSTRKDWRTPFKPEYYKHKLADMMALGECTLGELCKIHLHFYQDTKMHEQDVIWIKNWFFSEYCTRKSLKFKWQFFLIPESASNDNDIAFLPTETGDQYPASIIQDRSRTYATYLASMADAKSHTCSFIQPLITHYAPHEYLYLNGRFWKILKKSMQPIYHHTRRISL